MCIGLHTLPPCLLFCGNYILHESEYDVHIFCVALDIIIYPAALTADMVNRLSALYCIPLEDLISDNEECLQNADDLSGYSVDNLKAIADVSRIALNANFMTRRLKANKVL